MPVEKTQNTGIQTECTSPTEVHPPSPQKTHPKEPKKEPNNGASLVHPSRRHGEEQHT